MRWNVVNVNRGYQNWIINQNTQFKKYIYNGFYWGIIFIIKIPSHNFPYDEYKLHEIVYVAPPLIYQAYLILDQHTMKQTMKKKIFNNG